VQVPPRIHPVAARHHTIMSGCDFGTSRRRHHRHARGVGRIGASPAVNTETLDCRNDATHDAPINLSVLNCRTYSPDLVNSRGIRTSVLIQQQWHPLCTRSFCVAMDDHLRTAPLPRSES
jgi:hypothetical protein